MSEFEPLTVRLQGLFTHGSKLRFCLWIMGAGERIRTADRPLTRSFHLLVSTAAFQVRAGFVVPWLRLDVSGFRSVLARGWHAEECPS